MTWTQSQTLILVLALSLVSACGAPDQSENPQDPVLVAEGSALYEANCAACHGSDLRGTDRGPSHLSQVYEPNHHGDGAFLLAVQAGSRAHHWDFGPMPPIEGITTEQVEAIVAFVREQQRQHGFEPYPP